METVKLKPCPAGHTSVYVVSETRVGVNLTAVAYYAQCECGWRGPERYAGEQSAVDEWNTRQDEK